MVSFDLMPYGVFPARAGMIPPHTAPGHGAGVFPARAGMILAKAIIIATCTGIPRESGDDPRAHIHSPHAFGYSPRERG